MVLQVCFRWVAAQLETPDLVYMRRAAALALLPLDKVQCCVSAARPCKVLV